MRDGRGSPTRRRVAIVVLIIVLAPIGWWLSAYPRGMCAAWIDCSRGHEEVKQLGLPKPWFWEYRRVANERYGVEVRPLGCNVTPGLEWYVNGYNSVSQNHILDRLGRDVLAECAAEVQVASEHEPR